MLHFLIFQARSEINQKKKMIVGDEFKGEFVSLKDCMEMVEKWVERAYNAGKREKDSAFNLKTFKEK